MPLSWVMRDALGQFNVLVARKGQLEISNTNIRPSARASDLTALSPAGLGNPQSLGEGDVRTSLRLLVQFMLTTISAEEIGDACSHLVTLAKQYEGIDHNRTQVDPAAGSKGAPSTSDKKETVDDKKDSSVTFLILDTMCQLIGAVLGLEGDASAHALRTDLFRIDQRAAAAAVAVPPPATSSITGTVLGPIVPADARPAAIGACASLVPFAFSYLQHIYSSAVRHAACRLLGALSVTFLPNVTALLVEKMQLSKKDQAQREFASYQRAARFLDFRVGSPASVRVTLDYLTAVLAEMKNIDRGVLRQEVCLSIDSIYTKILAPNPLDPRREAEWSAFVRGEKGVEDWQVLFERVYAALAKWSSKSKHMLFCYEGLAHMAVFCRNAAFFHSKKRFDIFGELVKSIRGEKGEAKQGCMLILARFYLHHLPAAFLVGEQQQEFQAQLRTLLPVLMPKKTKPVPEEIPLLTELLAEAGGKNLPFFVEAATEILAPKSQYMSRQRAVMLQALGTIAMQGPERQRELAAFHMQLGPLVAPYIEESALHIAAGELSASGGGGGASRKDDAGEEDKQILLLRAALRCFPHIRHPKMEHVQITAAAVIMLCKHDDREISGQVSASLAAFIQLDLNQFFLPTLHTLADLLKLDHSIDTRPDQILRICNTISFLCNTLAEHVARQEAGADEGGAVAASSPSSAAGGALGAEAQLFQVTPGAWLSLREHLESVVLLRLCHYEGWVRSELLRMLRNFSRQLFRQFEAGAVASPGASPSRKELLDIPFLIDYLMPESSVSLAAGAAAASSAAVIVPTPELFYRPLHDLLSRHYDLFHGIVSHAFSFLHKDLEIIHTYLDQSRAYTAELVQEEWYLFFRNKLLFACLAARPTSAAGDSLEGVEQKSSILGAHDLALKFTSSRPRLVHYSARAHEVQAFYDNICSFLQAVPPSQAGMSPAQAQAYNTAPATSGMYLVKLNIAKDLAQIRPGGPGPARVGAPAGSPHSASSSNSAGGAAAGAGAGNACANYVELAKHLRKPLSEHEALLAAQAANPQQKKKKGPDVKSTYYQNEFVLHVLAGVFAQVRPEDYHAGPSALTKCLDDLVAVWGQAYESNGLEAMRAMGVRTRLHQASLVGRFLAYRSGIDVGVQHVHHMSKFDCMRRKAFWFQLVTHLFPSTAETAQAAAALVDHTAADNLRALETAVLGALTQLLQMDAMQDQQLEGQILYFIERILVQQGRGSGALAPHLHVGITNSLNTFLKLNPKYVAEFVRMSFDTHSHLEGANTAAKAAAATAEATAANQRAGGKGKKARRGSVTLSKDERHLIHRDAHPDQRMLSTSVSRYYLRALATNWTQDMAFWTAQGVPTASMLLVALLAQTVADPESRAIGLLLAAELEKHHAASAGSGSIADGAVSPQPAPIRLYSHESPFMYLESTQSYSHSLAVQSSYLVSILPLLREAVTLFGFVSASKKEALVRILLPWVYEVATMLSRREQEQAAGEDGEGEEAASAAVKDLIAEALQALTDLTRLSYADTILNEPIQQMWTTLLSNDCLNERLVKLITTHVVQEYYELVELADLHKQQQIEAAMVARQPTVARLGSASSRAPVTAAAPLPTPTVARKPSVVVQPSGSSSPTNLANLTAGVTNVGQIGGSPVPERPEEDEENKEDGEEQSGAAPAAAALAAGAQPISLAVEDNVPETQEAPCPSPVTDSADSAASGSAAPLHVEVEAQPAASPTPSPEVQQQQHHVDEIGLSSVRAALDAGGAARVQAAVPMFSPVSQGGAHVPQSAPVAPKAPLTARGVAKEKALRKMIVMQMLRSAVAQEILVNLVSELRSYEDHCPADPDAFVKFAETRIMGGGPGQEASGEPLTIVERAVFELLSNGVFENRHTNPAVASEAARTRVAPASGEDVLTPYYPLLLHNAYALFHSTPEGHEMLVHLALALGLYEHNDASVSGAAARDTLIASDRFIPLLVKSYPELRHRWSALALSWACNSLDQSVAAVSFTLWSQLESPSFFFGEHSQENLVRAELQLFLTLRRNDTQNLKSIVSTLISPTAYPYDKQGWTSLVSCGWALLVLSSVPHFSLGLSLLQSLFSLPGIPAEEQRRWILSLGRFLCRDSGQEVDAAIVDVLTKGLISQRTYQPTLILLQSMSEIYAGATLPADNKLVVLLMLVNTMHRIMDVERLADLYRKHTIDAGAEAAAGAGASSSRGSQHFSFVSHMVGVPQSFSSMDAAVEQGVVRGVDDCVNLSLLLHSYAQSENQGQRHLSKLANVFKNVALSLSRMLPDANNDGANDEAASASRPHAAALANWNRQLLFKKMVALVQTVPASSVAPVGGANVEQDEASQDAASNAFSNAHSPRASSEHLDGAHLPTATQLASQFFIALTPFFSSASNFDFILSFFYRMLANCPGEWRATLLLMLGHFLLESTHFPNNAQFQLLAEITTSAMFNLHSQAQEAKLAEQIAFILIEKRPNGDSLNRHTDLFNFVRARQMAKKPAASTSAAASSAGADVLVVDGRYDPQSELTEALNRIETHTFPILKQMLGNPRAMQRPMDAHAAKIARQAHVRSASSSAALLGNSAGAHRQPLLQKRLSFATLGEFSASAGIASSGSSGNLQAIRESEVPAQPSPPAAGPPPPTAVAAAAAAVDEDEDEKEDVPVAPAVGSSNPFGAAADDDDNAAAGESQAHHTPAAAPAPPRKYSDSPPAAVPVPIPHRAFASAADDSDDDDAALFAAATRRLSNSGNPAANSRRGSAHSRAEPEGDRVSDDE